VEPFIIKNTESLETVLYKTSTNVELQNINELSSLKTADLYGTISMVDCPGNAPKNPSTQPVRHIITGEVYTNLVQLSTKEAMDIKSNKIAPNSSHQ
jgi:hypothetical protein